MDYNNRLDLLHTAEETGWVNKVNLARVDGRICSWATRFHPKKLPCRLDAGATWLHMLLSSGFFDSPSFPCMQLRRHKRVEWWDELIDKHGDTDEVKASVVNKLDGLADYDKVLDEVEHKKAPMDSKEVITEKFFCTVSSLLNSDR